VVRLESFGWLSGTPALAHAITKESADELKLAVEQMVYAIIKASSVMVGVD
jgi:molybdopterin-binding protein